MSSDREVIERAAARAHELMRYSGCAQAVLLALQEEFGIGDAVAFKAASALSAGVAYQGETCGALVGALMALGLAAGRERMEDTPTYRAAMRHGMDIWHRFREELQRQFGFGQAMASSLCSEIQRNIFGRAYNMADEAERQAFLAAGAHGDSGCPRVCAVAAQVTAEKLLECMKRP